jgi:hypothetical protein
MKFIAALLILWMAAPAYAGCVGFDNALGALEVAVSGAPRDLPTVPFDTEFTSAEALKAWAQSSTFGGGRAEEATLAGHDLILVFRGYTSGIKTSDIGIYVLHDGKYRFIKGIGPIRSWVDTHVYADQIVFTPEGGTQELLTLKVEELK